MTTPPPMDDNETVTIDFALSCDSSCSTSEKWNDYGQVNDRNHQCQDLVSTEHYGPVTILKGISSINPTSHPRYSDSTFNGVCVDTGAQVSVCGKRQAIAFCKTVSIPFALRPSNLKFKFGNTVTDSMGIMKFRCPAPDGGSIDLDMDVIDLDIPLLLGLRELRDHQLLVDYLDNTLLSQ